MLLISSRPRPLLLRQRCRTPPGVGHGFTPETERTTLVLLQLAWRGTAVAWRSGPGPTSRSPSQRWPHQQKPWASMMQVPLPQQRGSSSMGVLGLFRLDLAPGWRLTVAARGPVPALYRASVYRR